jgi:hypothetical protein
VQDAVREKQAVVHQILAGRDAVEELHAEAARAAGTAQETAEQEHECRISGKRGLPVLELTIKMFALASGVVVREAKECSDDLVTGFVTGPETREVFPFRYDLSTMSCYEATNQLWAIKKIS